MISVEVAKASERTIEIPLQLAEQKSPDIEPGSPADTSEAPVTARVTESTPTQSSRWARPWAWIAVAGGGVGIVTGVLLRKSAADIIDEDLFDVPAGDDRDSDIKKVRIREALSWTSLGLGAASLGLGVYLFARADQPYEQPPVAIGPAPDGTGGMVWVQWSR
jgi:hypothetical protein